MLHRFEEGFDRVWRRAASTLGEISLVAVTRRVLHHTAKRYPPLASLEVSHSGLESRPLDELRARGETGELGPEALEEMLGAVLVELLTVVGRLTAEILTPALHEALEPAPSAGESDPPSASTSNSPGPGAPGAAKETPS